MNEADIRSNQGRLQAIIGDHLGLVLSGVAFVVIAAKLLAVSHGDAQTALSILSIRGWTTLPNILVAMLPTLMVVAAAFSVMDMAERIRERDKLGRLPLLVLGLVCSAIVIGPRSWVLVCGALALGIVVIGLLMRWGSGFIRSRIESLPSWLGWIIPGGRPRSSEDVRSVAILFGVTGLVVAAALPQPWLPLERVTLVSGPRITGFILGEQADQNAILLDRDRRIVWIRSEDLRIRETCAQDYQDRAFLPSFVWPVAATSTDGVIKPWRC